MKELKEFRVGDDRLALQDNLVKTGILPKGTKELERSIVIQGDVVIEGPVYGKNIIIETGPAVFSGAVYAHNEMHIQTDARNLIRFSKAVGSSQSIVSLASGAQILFGADITAKSIKLKNAFVAASIFAEEIMLENCVVLGGVFATRKMVVQNVITGTFNSPEVNAGGINYILYPTAFSVEPIALLPGTLFYNLTLSDLGSLYKGQPEKAMTGKIPLNMKTDTQRTVLVDDQQNTIIVNSYSVAGKVLVTDMTDLDKMENHFLLTAASLGSQLCKTYSFPDSDSLELTLENISVFFFRILSGQIQIHDLNGYVTFEDIKKIYNA